MVNIDKIIFDLDKCQDESEDFKQRDKIEKIVKNRGPQYTSMIDSHIESIVIR